MGTPSTSSTSDSPLRTSVIGSYSVPEWLQRIKTDHHRGRVSAAHLDAVHDVVIKAAIKDQERAGVDVVSDGELRRDNDVDYLLARIPGVHIACRRKEFFYDYHRAEVTEALPESDVDLGLAEEFRFVAAQTDNEVNFSITGPFSLSRRIRNTGYPDEQSLVRALARTLNAEAHRVVAAGARRLQIDEPYLAGHPEHVELAVEAVNTMTEGVAAETALHVCYGNRYARPSWEGHYDFLFPAVLGARIDRLVLEFARKGYDDLRLLHRYPPEFALGVGVIDVKNEDVESAEVVASRIRRALDVLPAERVMINPDCGLRHLPSEVARRKLVAMVEGAAKVRAELTPATPGTGKEVHGIPQ